MFPSMLVVGSAARCRERDNGGRIVARGGGEHDRVPGGPAARAHDVDRPRSRERARRYRGALLLLATSDQTFTKILPLLMFAASAVFTLGPRLSRMWKGAHMPLAFGALVQLLISSYGGYFGGGMGILMLATFTLMGMTHLHSMNGLKTLLGMLINGAANIAFFIAHKVVIDVAVPVAIGSIVGGWFGAAIARKIDPDRVRTFVLLFAWGLTAWFFYAAVTRK